MLRGKRWPLFCRECAHWFSFHIGPLTSALSSHPKVNRCWEAVPYAMARIREKTDEVKLIRGHYAEKPWFAIPFVEFSHTRLLTWLMQD